VTKPRAIALGAVLLLIGILVLRFALPSPPPPAPRPPAIVIPPLPDRPPSVPVAAPSPSPAPPEPPPADRLRPYIEKLGRARLLRDRRTLDELRRKPPPIFDTDREPLRAWVGGDLFLAAGVAELARLFGWQDAVPALAAALGRPGHELLKDVVIESLASLGGDAAETALLSALRNDADDGIRLRCVAALPGFHGAEVYRCLIDALRDPIPRVRSAAAAALARMNAAGTVDALLRALGEERDPSVQADLAVSTYAVGGEASREPLVRLLELRPESAELLRLRVRLRDDSRYRRPYERGFFEPGGPSIPYDGTKPRIGITIEEGAGVTPGEIAILLFGVAPLDRYRGWFYLRKADEFPSMKAYDGYGNPLDSVPYGDFEGTVFLHFRDPASFAKGILGYTKGCHAYVQGTSLLHEFGHAFAKLGDEYADGSRDAAANLFQQPAAPWMPLVTAQLLPVPQRRDADFYVPSENCFLSNKPEHSRYCPVCQLEIHARMAEMCGAPLPW